MCKHVAAVLYGVGARLDLAPGLLFRLRAVDEAELLAGMDTALPLSRTGPAAGKVLKTDDVSALFGLDMVAPDVPAPGKPSDKTGTARRRHARPAPEGVAPATSKAPTRTVAAPTALARANANGRDQTSVKSRDGADASGRAKTASLATPEAPKMPVPSRATRSVAAAKPTTARQPKPKPVKWW